MRKLMLFIALPVFGLPVTSLVQQQAIKDPLVGCYSLEVNPWELPLSPYQRPPERIQLSDEIGKGPLARWRHVARPVIPYGDTLRAFWERVGSDSVRVTWTDGFSSVQLDLQIGADSLHGTVSVFTDKLGAPPMPQAEAVARRTTCNEEPHARVRQPNIPPAEPRAAGDQGPAVISSYGVSFSSGAALWVPAGDCITASST